MPTDQVHLTLDREEAEKAAALCELEGRPHSPVPSPAVRPLIAAAGTKLRAALEGDGGEGHRLSFEIEGGVIGCVKLLHGDGGCDQSANFDGACVLVDWVENCAEELLNGSVEVPIEIEWLNDDSPKLTISGPTLNPQQEQV